jgi:hypothetical protein
LEIKPPEFASGDWIVFFEINAIQRKKGSAIRLNGEFGNLNGKNPARTQGD